MHEFSDDLRVSVITLALMCLVCVPPRVKVTGTDVQEALTNDEEDNPTRVTVSTAKVVHQGLGGHVIHAFFLPLWVETLKFVCTNRELELTASIRFFFATSPVSSTASLPGIPQVL